MLANFFKKMKNRNEFYVVLDNKKYAFDVKKIKDVCFVENESDREITEGFEHDGNGLSMTSKIIREYRSNSNDQNSMIVYDVVKLLILKILESDSTDFNDNLGLVIAINTCIDMGIIYEIND